MGNNTPRWWMRLAGIALSLMLILVARGKNPAIQAKPAPQAKIPPTIILFQTDASGFTMDEVESGEMVATVWWSVYGWSADYRLALEVSRLNQWEGLFPETPTDPNSAPEPLTPSGRLQIPINHPLTFQPPTYRLVVYEGETDTVVDEWRLSIPYILPMIGGEVNRPTIEAFTTVATKVDVWQLSAQTARIPVTWAVRNRLPATNLVFEQILPDTRIVSAELARSNLWVQSRGEGILAPVLPPTGDSIQIQVRVVDLAENITYDSATFTLPIDRTSPPTPTTAPPLPSPIATRPPTITPLPLPPTDIPCEFVYFFGAGGRGCPTSATSTLYIAYQQFEGGSMIWHGDSEVIYVLYDGGQLASFIVATYNNYPDNTITDAPEGRVAPFSGFGKVWGNNENVRIGLGWGLADEQGFEALYQAVQDPTTANMQFYVELPTGHVIGIGYGSWVYIN